METFIVLICVVAIIYFIYSSFKDEESKRQLEQIETDKRNSKSLEDYTAKKSLFKLYSNYFYENINYFNHVFDYKAFENKFDFR